MKSLCTIVMFISLFAAATLAQPSPDTLWTRTYGGSNRDEAWSVQQTTDGGYVVAGLTHSCGAGGADLYLVKTNDLGDTLWTRTYGGIEDDEAHSVQQIADGGYIIAGETWSFGAGECDFYLVKTDSQGDTLWTRTFGGSWWDEAYSVQQTSDGGYIVAGYTMSFGVGWPDFYLVKTNSQGDTLWTRTYGGDWGDKAWSIQQTAEGGYIVVGYRSYNDIGRNFYLVKTDSQGDTLWTHTYAWYGLDMARSVQQTSDGGYIVAGGTYEWGLSSNFYVVKTNSQGDSLWTRTYGGSGSGWASSVQQTFDGGYIIAGHDGWVDYPDFYLVKTNNQGDTLWTRRYWESAGEARSVRQTSDGGYIIAGSTRSFGAGGNDFYVVKTGPDISEIEPARITTPNEYILYPAFPNPFNPSTQITFALPKAGEVSLKVFNLLGHEVATLAHGMQSAGTHSVSFDGSALASGIYFYRLQAGDFVYAQKMVLLK